MATGLFKLDDFRDENKENVQGFTFKFKNIIKHGISPCPWADYLKCVPQNVGSVDNLLEDAQTFMSEQHGIHSGAQAGGTLVKGGYQDGGNNNSLRDILESVDTATSFAKKVEKQMGKVQSEMDQERIRAAAAITYISRLFALGLEDDVDDLRDYSRKRNMELDEVVFKLASYIKNTRTDKM